MNNRKIETQIHEGGKHIYVNIRTVSGSLNLGWNDKKQAEHLREVLKEAVNTLDYFISENCVGSVIEQQRHGAGKEGE